MSLSGPEPGNRWCPSQCCALHCAADPRRSGQGLALPCCFLWMFLHSRLLRLVSNQSFLHKIKSSWIQWIYLLTYHILTKNIKNYFLEVSVLKQFWVPTNMEKGALGTTKKITICEEEDRSWSFLSWLPGPSFQESPEVRVEIDLRTPSANLKSPHGREGSLYCEMFQKHMFFCLGHTPKNIRVRCQRLNLEGAATLPSAGSQGYMTRTHYTDHNII